MRFRSLQLLALASLSCVPVPAFAQAPPARSLAMTASAGLALTSGNKDTSTVNIGSELAWDPKTRNIVKADALYLRGKAAGELTADRLVLNGRDEYKLHDGAFVFGQMQYLRDQFKDIAYLAAPGAGLGYRLAETPRTQISIDAGLGGVWEKSLLGDVRASGAVTLGEKLSRQLTATAVVTQSFAALYKTQDFGDALYSFGSALSVSVTTRTQLKVEVLDTYRTLITEPIVRNDVALIVGMVFKR